MSEPSNILPVMEYARLTRPPQTFVRIEPADAREFVCSAVCLEIWQCGRTRVSGSFTG